MTKRDDWSPKTDEFSHFGNSEASYAPKYYAATVIIHELRKALAVAKCLYDNDKLTRLGEHLERETKR